jgi:hypothetical protein
VVRIHEIPYELFAGDVRLRKRGEGVAYEFGVYVAVAVEGSFEGEDDEHAVDALLDPAQAAALPGPELRADEPEDRDAEASAVFGEAEVDVGEVDEDSEIRPGAFEVGDQLAILPEDEGGVADDLRDAHVGDVFGADDASLAGDFHLCATEAGECGGDAAAEFGDDLGAVVVAGGFAGGEEDARVGRCGDEVSLWEDAGARDERQRRNTGGSSLRSE